MSKARQSLVNKCLVKLALAFEGNHRCCKACRQTSTLPLCLRQRLEYIVESMSVFRQQFGAAFDLQKNANKIVIAYDELDVNETLKGAPSAEALVIAIRNDREVYPKEIFSLLSAEEKEKFTEMARKDNILWINWQLIHGLTFYQECSVLRQYFVESARAGCTFTLHKLLNSIKDATTEGLERLLVLVEEWCNDDVLFLIGDFI
uniref:DHC_N2 domain-containing protein n=1 Tax=Steinernema glaseri TaxID=37863 RepID=A0A1I7YQK8_9BILA